MRTSRVLTTTLTATALTAAALLGLTSPALAKADIPSPPPAGGTVYTIHPITDATYTAYEGNRVALSWTKSDNARDVRILLNGTQVAMVEGDTTSYVYDGILGPRDVLTASAVAYANPEVASTFTYTPTTRYAFGAATFAKNGTLTYAGQKTISDAARQVTDHGLTALTVTANTPATAAGRTAAKQHLSVIKAFITNSLAGKNITGVTVTTATRTSKKNTVTVTGQ
jgi:hypothetical protein